MALVACGGSSSGSIPDVGQIADVGQYRLSSLDELCEGVPGLNGSAIFAAQAAGAESTLAYFDLGGMLINPTALSVTFTWPDSPSATCFPEFAGEGLVAPSGPRVGIDGLRFTFVTADGKFNEDLPAKAWVFSSGGIPSGVWAFAGTGLGSLRGTFEPDPIFNPELSTVTFSVALDAIPELRGFVILSPTELSMLRAGLFASGSAMAVWPQVP